MKTNRPQYVWVVAGIIEGAEGDSYLTVSEPCGAHTSQAKAQAELAAILQEIREEATGNGYEFSYEMDDKMLEVTFESGQVETYKIFKMLVN